MVNGQKSEWHGEAPNLVEWLQQQTFTPPFAIARNCQFVPKHQWAATQLQEGDALEIVRAVTGG